MHATTKHAAKEGKSYNKKKSKMHDWRPYDRYVGEEMAVGVGGWCRRVSPAHRFVDKIGATPS